MSEENKRDAELDDNEQTVTETENTGGEKNPYEDPVEGESKEEKAERVSYKKKWEEAQSEMEEMRKVIKGRNKENEKRRMQIKQWEELGLEPDTVAEWKKEREEAELKKAEEKGEWEKIRSKILEENDKKLQAKDAEVAEMKATLENLLVDSKITEELLKRKGKPELLSDKMKQRVQFENTEDGYKTYVLDENGERMVDDKGNYLGIDYLADEFMKHPVYSMGFDSPEIKGNATKVSNQGDRNGKPSNVPKMKRSEMSTKEKLAFQEKYGIDEYAKLPL